MAIWIHVVYTNCGVLEQKKQLLSFPCYLHICARSYIHSSVTLVTSLLRNTQMQ